MSVAGYCDKCDHPASNHGDRAIGGICATWHYPNACPCPGYTNEGEAA